MKNGFVSALVQETEFRSPEMIIPVPSNFRPPPGLIGEPRIWRPACNC